MSICVCVCTVLVLDFLNYNTNLLCHKIDQMLKNYLRKILLYITFLYSKSFGDFYPSKYPCTCSNKMTLLQLYPNSLHKVKFIIPRL